MKWMPVIKVFKCIFRGTPAAQYSLCALKNAYESASIPCKTAYSTIAGLIPKINFPESKGLNFTILLQSKCLLSLENAVIFLFISNDSVKQSSSNSLSFFESTCFPQVTKGTSFSYKSIEKWGTMPLPVKYHERNLCQFLLPVFFSSTICVFKIAFSFHFSDIRNNH